MGYSTNFKGELKFSRELTASELAKVKSFLGEDVREHPEWKNNGLYYIDLELTDDFSGVKWDGSEKTYGMDEAVNLIIREMRKEVPDFGFTGTLSAQGERFDDRWQLVINANGLAEKQDIVLTGKIITCPHCEEKFELESN